LLQFGRQRAKAREGFWLALEEPELHVPPPLQRRLVYRIQTLSTQTFISTHSPTVAAMSDPRSVIVLRNEGGALLSTPLLSATLPLSTTNAVRKLFHLNRVDTIAALMHEVVLVPEGRIDQEWLKLLVRAVDLNQGWPAVAECRFGANVGVIPTHDAAVEATMAVLAGLHPRITALVDGDSDGVVYAQALSAAAKPPEIILRWPDNWTIENVVGRILKADAARAIEELANVVVPPPPSIDELVTRLKSEDRSAGGMKQDQLAYEAIADIIGAIDKCCSRARTLLNAMCDVLLGGSSLRFAAASGGDPTIRIFRPQIFVRTVSR
jgi:putative ATP-dependent endonuclease of OLD family